MRPDQGTAVDPPRSAATPYTARTAELGRVHRVLIGVVAVGAIVIASIGFAGSYAAVRELAMKKGFGAFALVFPIGIDAGIVVLLALDLLLTWVRIPFPLLRQAAWLLTGATIAFNAASAWPDPLGVGMHGIIPVLFVVAVEAARHAIGRIADITADRHMEGVRLWRWILAPLPTFRLWRRMKLWELRSYDDVIRLEQDRLIYRARLQARYGRTWRRKAPVESLMPLRLARYGVPLADTGPAGLEAAGIELPALEQPSGRPELPRIPEEPAPSTDVEAAEHTRYEATAEQTADHWRAQSHPEQYIGEHAASGREQEESRTAGLHAPAQGLVAASSDGRAPAVQARVDVRAEETPGPAVDESQASPIGDSSPPQAETEAPQLTGRDLLEHRWLQLPRVERNKSDSSLARALHDGTGLTEGTARKYLKLIKDKHLNRA